MVDPKASKISSTIGRSSSKVSPHLSRATPNRTRGGDNRTDIISIPNKTSINRAISNDVSRGPIVRHHGTGTTITSAMAVHEPHISNEVGIRCHKKRPVTNPNMNDVSTPEDEDIDGVLATGFGGSNSKKRRGVGNFSKISQMTRVTGKLIEIRLDPVHGRPTGDDKSSLLSSSIGCIVRNCIPMHGGYWGTVDDIEKEEAIRTLMSFYDFETNEEGQIEPRTSHYLEELFAKAFREFKSELKTYFQKFSPEDAKCNLPPRWNKRGNDNWITMCNHFLSEKFQNQSQKNKENRGQKEYEHHGGSKPMSLRYEKYVKEEMVSQSKLLLKELAPSYPEVTELAKIIVPLDASRKIVMNTLGIKPGKQIRGLGFGSYRYLGSSKTTQDGASSNHTKKFEQEIADLRTSKEDTERRLHVSEKRLYASERKSAALAKAFVDQGFSLPEEFYESEDDNDTT